MLDSLKPILLLFCSAARPQYAQDVLNVMALPEGAVMHFRYREPWVAKVLQTYDLDAFNGMQALCSLVEQIEGGSARFFPLRYGKIFAIIKEGGVFHVYFIVGKFSHVECGFAVHPSTGSDYFDKIIKRATDSFQELSKDGLPPVKFFSCCKDGEKLKAAFGVARNDSEGWQNLTTIVSSIEAYRKAIFLRVGGVQKLLPWWQWYEDFKRIDIGPEAQSKPVELSMRVIEYLETGYEITHGATHVLCIAYYQAGHGNKSGDLYQIEVKCSDKHFHGPGEMVPILTRFDSVRVKLFPLFGVHVAISPIRIAVRRSRGSGDSKTDFLGMEDVLSPDITIPLKLSHGRRLLTKAVLLVILGALVHFGLDPAYRQYTVPVASLILNDWLLQHIIALRAPIGYICYGAAGLLVSRKLPVKI